ncbi:hypothetical protein HD806DRAFT_521842 [Xylariaceae sp. AK1471]|nr:hypothetical protein HD806DRAFT_521842 [Xylariaceae sp. AK1471]
MASQESNTTTYTDDEVDKIIEGASHQSLYDNLCVSFYKSCLEIDYDQRDLLKPFAPFSAAGSTTASSLGVLDSLPMEVLIPILMELDLSSAVQFSHVSRRAREVTSTIFEYRKLREHGMEFLCALILMEMAPHVTMQSLFRTLTTEHCLVCGKFGGYVFLPNLTRCCYACVESQKPEVSAESLIVVSRRSGLTYKELRESLPAFRAPRIISDDSTYTQPINSHYLRIRRNSYRGRYSALTYIVTDLDRRGVESRQARVLGSFGRRFMRTHQTMACLPYFNVETGEAQLAHYCNACLLSLTRNRMNLSGARIRARDPGYSREGFMKHFEECEEAKEQWRIGVRGLHDINGAIHYRRRLMNTNRRKI